MPTPSVQSTHHVSSANLNRENDLLLSVCWVRDAIHTPSGSPNLTSASFRKHNRYLFTHDKMEMM